MTALRKDGLPWADTQVVPVPSALIPASQRRMPRVRKAGWEGDALICRAPELDRWVRPCSLVSLGGVSSSESAMACCGKVLKFQNLLVWLAFILFDGDLDPVFICKNACKSFTKR